MPVALSIDTFLDTLRKSQLVEASRLQTFLKQQEEDETPLPAEPRAMAVLLVREGLITRWQAQQLLLGKSRGFVINGKYRLLEMLGSGGMGTVYLCEHVMLRRVVALKALPLDKGARNASAVDRFYREGQAVAALNHPNIVRCHDLDRENKLHFIVMEYVDGSSLNDIVKNHGPMTVQRAAHYIAQAAEGLQHAHEAGWVHRDIKPGNLLLDRAGVVKVLDMGLARLQDDRNGSVTQQYNEHSVLGTADFVAPEQALNSHDVDIRADIYSLGATFYFLLAGRPPFPHSTIAQKLLAHQMHDPDPLDQLRPDVPEEMEAVIATMMAKDRDERYQTPEEVMEALQPWTETPIPTPPEQEMPRHTPLVARLAQVNLVPAPGSASSSSLRNGSRSSTGGPSRPASSSPSMRSMRSTEPNLELETHITPTPAPVPPSLAGPPSTVALLAASAVTKLDALRERVAPLARRRRLVAGVVWLVLVVVVVNIVGAIIFFGLMGSGETPNPGGGKPPVQPGSSQPPADSGAHGSVLPANPGPADGNRFLCVPKGKGASQGFGTLAEAVAAAGPGDHVVVRTPLVTGALRLEGARGEGLTIEVDPSLNQPVVWQPAANHSQGQPLLEVKGCPGFRLNGPIVLDGQGRLDAVAKLVGKSPSLRFEDVHLTGIRGCGLQVANCQGESKKSVTLSRLRLTTAPNPDTLARGIVIDGGQNLMLEDCRLEGGFAGAILVSHEVKAVTVTRTRFFRPAEAVRFSDQLGCHQELTLANNTFAGGNHALFFEQAPDENTKLTVRNNYFTETTRLAGVLGVRYEPPPAQAPCARIWTDEADPKTFHAPGGDRFFRKVFDLPVGGALKRAWLDITADDAFVAWVNGRLVGEGGIVTRRVHGFDLRQFLVPGRNVIAIKATNVAGDGKTNPAGLIAQVTVEQTEKATLRVVTDETWKVTQGTTADWLGVDYDDANWPAARTLTPASAEALAWPGLCWDGVVQEQFPGSNPPKLTLKDNVMSTLASREGYPYLSPRVEWNPPKLGADPNNDQEFLRYPVSHRLTRVAGGSPVGVPPAVLTERPKEGKTTTLFRLDLGAQKSLVQRIGPGEKAQLAVGEGQLTEPLIAGTWDATTVAEVVAEKVDGAMAVGLRNLEGRASVQFLVARPLARLEAGRVYLIRVEYLTTGSSKPNIRLEDGGFPNVIMSQSLDKADGHWKVFQTTLNESKDIPLSLNFQNDAVGADKTFYIKSIEGTEVAP
jgi:eukaryotic-like serine/threonine-protein kinase